MQHRRQTYTVRLRSAFCRDSPRQKLPLEKDSDGRPRRISAELLQDFLKKEQVEQTKVNVCPVSRLRQGDPWLQPPICDRPTLLAATCVLLGRPVTRLIHQELITIHPGRGFTHDKGLILSSSDEAWLYALGFPPTLPSQMICINLRPHCVSNGRGIHTRARGP